MKAIQGDQAAESKQGRQQGRTSKDERIRKWKISNGDNKRLLTQTRGKDVQTNTEPTHEMNE